MLKHVPFAVLGLHQLELIARSLLAAPEDVRLDAAEFVKDIEAGRSQIFECDGDGLVVVGKRDRRLILEAFCCAPPILMENCRTLAVDLRRLAADWQCDAIETLCCDPRLTRVIQHLGGHVESMTLVLKVAP